MNAVTDEAMAGRGWGSVGDEGAAARAELAARLRLLRAERRLSVTALERRSGLGRTTISQALNGRKVPSEATVIALAKALGTSPSPLLELRSRAVAPTTAAVHEQSDEDVAFERRYRDYVIDRYSQLTVVGLDLTRPEGACWPLDTAYLSLELAARDERSDMPASWPEGHGTPMTVERAEQALAGRQRTVIRGLAGSGKTTLLHWLAVMSARQNPPSEMDHLRHLMPFVLPLRTLDRQSALPGPHSFLEATGSMLAAAQPTGWADRVLTAGRGLLLIDGIDEVPQQRREHTRAWLRELLAAYPQAYVLVTTRPTAVPEHWLDGSGFTELTVRPMNRRDVLVFVNRWHCAAKAAPCLEESFTEAVRGQRDLAQLATTPLMCALMCALHRDRRGHLPRSRMELYEAALSMLLVRRDHERGIDAPEGISLTRHQSVQLLQRLAYWLIRNGQTEMEEESALAVVEEALPAMPAVSAQGDARQVLTHLVGRSGLLRKPTADTIDFVHRTFQDYLGAKAAVEARDLGLLVRHAHDAQWEDVLRMAVAHARPTERATLLRRLVARGDRTAKHRTRLHLLAMACLEQATELEPGVREAVESRAGALLPPWSYAKAKELASVGPVILDLLPGPEGLEDEAARAVVQTAVAVGGDAALPLLKRYRDCTDRGVQSSLASGWSSFDTEEYAQEILDHLPDDVTVHVASAAELTAVRGLRTRSGISCNGNFSAPELMSAIDRNRLRILCIAGNHTLSDIGFIRQLPQLRDLTLTSNGDLFDLSPLDGLKISRLVLWGARPRDLAPVGRLPALEHLNLNTPLDLPSLAAFPDLPHLRELYLWRETCSSTALSGISALSGLEFLSFVPRGTKEAWQELTLLPTLTGMQVVDQKVSALGAFPPLPQVTQLILNNPSSHADLSPVMETFPNVRKLFIYCRSHSDPTVDLTPLAGIEGLTVHITDAETVTGLDLFPPGAITRFPRPRPRA
ncbi:NACHT domain-containing protein [Streptomyces syringium]|uniref:NACHT domain-containing protein n=1 Tax=Streptomyces syringium TaxID=76729 RepID=UPI003D93F1F9